MCAVDSAKKPRVLVADDEKVIADTLKLILAGAGYDVAVAYDGLAAVNMAEVWPPDLFLSDVFMPGLSGIEAATVICEKAPDCRVLLISGQANSNDLRQAIESKGQNFEVLLKPIHPVDLIAHIQAILRAPT